MHVPKENKKVISEKNYLGEDVVSKSTSEEHRVQEVPKKTARKRKMSPNSLKNLVQYNPNIKKQLKKETINEEALSEEEIQKAKEDAADDESLDLFRTMEVKVGGKSILLSELIAGVFPTYQTLNKREMVVFNNISATYLKDFENEELSYSDMDDVFSLALNKILELRLLKANKKKPKALSDLFIPLEKLKKHNDKLKEALSNTRKDRKKQTLRTGVSILDLAAEFDEERKKQLEEKEKEILEKEKEFLKTRIPGGNKDDIDAK